MSKNELTKTNFCTFIFGKTIPKQVDDGRPVLHKFSKATADANSMSSSPTPEWSFVCNGSGKNCNIFDGSFKAFRVYKDAGVEKVVAVPVWVKNLSK